MSEWGRWSVCKNEKLHFKKLCLNEFQLSRWIECSIIIIIVNYVIIFLFCAIQQSLCVLFSLTKWKYLFCQVPIKMIFMDDWRVMTHFYWLILWLMIIDFYIVGLEPELLVRIIETWFLIKFSQSHHDPISQSKHSFSSAIQSVSLNQQDT